jgi:hypothetical protein
MVFEPPPSEPQPIEPPPPPPDPNRHPIRVVVTDDLRRWRLTVFFRWLLAIPLLIWLFIWSIGAFFVAIVNWFATLIMGRSPISLHEFFAAYVRFASHLYGYLLLAAEPYPGFTGKPGYPVDVEIDPPGPQHRLKTLFRLLLGLPAFAIAGFLLRFPTVTVFYSNSTDARREETRYVYFTAGALFLVGFFAWVACLVKGRMPSGFRDLMAYGIRYGAQASGYLFLLTDRYPNTDPAEPPAVGPERPRFLRLELDDDLRRSRLTVFFRLLLFLPHYVWLVLWGIVAFLAIILNWFATLILGQAPSFLHRFLSAYVRYRTHVFAYVGLIGNPFPGFTGAGGTYPVDLAIGERERQHRLKTLFRLFLAIPAAYIYFVFFLFLLTVSFYGWFAALVLGRMPQGFRNVGAWTLRYGAEADAYFFILTDVYPYTGPWEFAPPAPAPPEPEPEPAPAFA